MARFAGVLAILIQKRSMTRLLTATVANEPNTVTDPAAPSNITPETLADMYRRLGALLTERGVRDQVRLMGGDVIEVPRNPQLDRLHQTNPFNQLAWLRFMSAHLAGVIDAYA